MSPGFFCCPWSGKGSTRTSRVSGPVRRVEAGERGRDGTEQRERRGFALLLPSSGESSCAVGGSWPNSGVSGPGEGLARPCQVVEQVLEVQVGLDVQVRVVARDGLLGGVG